MTIKITINSASAGKFHEETINGKPHLVTEMVSIEGDSVMNRLFYPFDAVNASYPQLDNLMAPASHPTVDGETVSAYHPLAINAFNVGAFVRNPRLENNSVKNELVFDIEVAEKDSRGKEAINRIRNGESIGVSTGLNASVNKKAGVFNGRDYDGEVRDIKFDHVAFLLDEPPAGDNTFTVNNEIIVCNLGNSAENLENREVHDMDKEKLVLAIIGNSSNGYTQADKDTLLGLSEDSLVNALYTKPIEKDFSLEDATGVVEAAGLTVNAADFDADGYKSFTANKQAFAKFQKEKQAEKATTVEKIVANSKMTKEQVEALSDDYLVNLLQTVCPDSADHSANNQGNITNRDSAATVELHEGA